MNPPVHNLKLSASKDGVVTLEVRAKPNAKNSAVGGVHEGALEMRLAAR
jgi:uncharacterized protein YggU (UPF0235/DUF167 family)